MEASAGCTLVSVVPLFIMQQSNMVLVAQNWVKLTQNEVGYTFRTMINITANIKMYSYYLH
uniref:Uncharacterized protein n=1 Tax=Arundo donax TaxID=35708 RepID=A0A0A8YXW9_ARUDO